MGFADGGDNGDGDVVGDELDDKTAVIISGCACEDIIRAFKPLNFVKRPSQIMLKSESACPASHV